ncbi:MAG: hypothetical protein QM533_04250 [Cytophagales bacterium]|nr:hypothetical protein [Cytophagales bacterium]
MTLHQQLQAAKTEEDVKDAYVKALGLKSLSKGLIDIRTSEIWFEAKESPTLPVAMFAQLLSYVRAAHKKGDDIPPFLAVFDREKAALMETKHALPLFKDKEIEWSTAASKVYADKVNLKKIQPYIEAHFVVYKIETHETEFIEAVKTGIKEGKFIRTPITPDNLKQVFDKWVDMVGKELEGVDEVDYALMFFADIMHDGKAKVIENLPARLVYDGDTPMFVLNGKTYELASVAGYRRFWAIYHRPPHQEYREYLLERRDSLLPIDERSFKGAYYTPLKVVDKAYDLLAKTLGKNWQQKYIVWDMCCGVGNLEVKHSNHRNVFMSTLDQADLDVMKASRTCVAATHFQYDYLNDDIDDFCQFDYSLTNKMPQALRQAIADAKANKKGAKKILVLMNPPYAEATNANNIAIGSGAKNKDGVAKTQVAACMNNYGKASNELFAQFVVRIQQEIPNATIAMFSKLKYVNAPNFEQFRDVWKAKYLGGFVVHSKAFDGLVGNFPIGFLVWDTSKKQSITEIETEVLDKEAQWKGIKQFYNLPNDTFLNVWLKRPRANARDVVPLKNAISPTTSEPRVSTWTEGGIAYMYCGVNDLQHAGQQTVLMSSVYHGGNGFYLTRENLWQAAVTFSVRRLITQTWLNDRDQFLQPSEPLTKAFKNDCLIWMLFNGSNLTASANNLEWNGKKWRIVNHFIPFTETEVNAKGRFESSFMSDYLKGLTLSKEATAVLDAGRDIWRAYHSGDFERKIREELKLNRPDVGWYQIRKALEAAGKESGNEFDFSGFKAAYDALSEKLRPMVYELGFLK